MANRSFALKIGKTEGELQGMKVDQLSWSPIDSDELPWSCTVRFGRGFRG